MSKLCAFGMCLLLVLLAGCASAGSTPAAVGEAELAPPERALPATDAVPGWAQAEAPRTYDRDTLYDFMDGAADLYFTYAFERLAVADYQGPDGGAVRVEIYRTSTPDDAYGLFTYNAYGEPFDLGVEGRQSESGLAFWQGHSCVLITARNAVNGATLRAFGQAVSAALPAGGTVPQIVASLPPEGLVPGSARFFREQMALDNFLWLGPENVLGLGPDVEGVVATYELDAGRATLLVVAFPNAACAQDARQGMEGAGVADLVIADTAGSTLGAVFGQIGASPAAELLGRALAAANQN
ncbi:MAG: DUF6599 family protein [Anaerolineae bacterium]